MSAKKKAILQSGEKKPNFRMFEDVKNGKSSIPNLKVFIEECEVLYAHAIVCGLSEEEIGLIISVICKCKLRIKGIEVLMKCLIPQTLVPANVIVNLMTWLLSVAYDNIKITTSILQWIVGLVDNDLVDIGATDNYYYHFLTMLLTEISLAPYAFRLLYKLTKPEDVMSQHIHNLSTLEAQNKYARALLWLFKTYKPYLFYEKDMRYVNINAMLNKIRCPYHTGMQLLKRRLNISPSVHLGLINNSDSQLQHFHNKGLIPMSYQYDETYRIHHVISLQQESNKIKFKLPDKIMSLLANTAGFHNITFSSVGEQKRFSLLLFDTLQTVFIRNESNMSYEEQTNFLVKILNLEEHMQQGIPVVTTFLINYLNIWDGSHHHYYILDLIKWATFSSFAELWLVLRPLHMLFVSSDVYMKCDIISALMECIRNMFTVELHRARQGWIPPFLKTQPMWLNEPLGTLQRVIRFIENLIRLGLCIELTSNHMLNQAVSFYEMMSYLEENCGLSLWTVVPSSVVYRSFFSSNPVALNRICRLTLRYKNVVIPMLKSSGLFEHFIHQVPFINEYCSDLINLFLGRFQELKTDETETLFHAMPKETMKRLTKVMKGTTVFDIRHHMPFSLYIFLHARIVTNAIPQTIEESFPFVKEYAPDVAGLIESFLYRTD